jgi:hypothetical protein
MHNLTRLQCEYAVVVTVNNFVTVISYDCNTFITTAPGANVIKLFTDAVYYCLKKARVLVPVIPFLPSLMLPSITGGYLSFTFQVLHSSVGSWPHPQTLDKAGEACQGQTL